MARVVLDTSVVIGVIKSEDALHQVVADAVGAARDRGDDFILPATVLSECLVHPYRIDPSIAEHMRDTVVSLFGPVRPLDAEVAMASVQLRLTHPALRPEDSWVIATGIVDDATVLTCDKRWTGMDARIQVLRP